MKKGFTLIELLIVIVVIGILVSIALPRFRTMQNEGNIAKAKGDLKTMQAALESYYSHNNNQYPANIGDLAEVESAFRMISSVPADPFSTGGAVYGYASNQRDYLVYSIGVYGNGSAEINTTGDGITEDDPSTIFISSVGEDLTGP